MRKNCLDYPVEVVEGAFSEGGTVLADVLKKVAGAEKPRILLVADQNVVSRSEGLGTRIGRWVQANGIELAAPPLLVSGCERVKCDDMRSATEIARTMLKAKVGKGDIVLVLGGGTLLDVTGWVAAQTRGGMPVVRLPTTPAAMVDAAFAEYSAVNCQGVKDALRAKCNPAAVVIDPTFAPTVLDGVWRAGFAAAMRIAAVSDAALVKRLVKLAPAYRERDTAALKEMVEATVAVRTKKGGTDFAIWSAHCLESMSSFKLPHGYAVAIAVTLDAAYATLKGALKEADRKTICDALAASGSMDGAAHSQHLLGQSDALLQGLDAWRLASGSEAIVLPAGLGKFEIEEKPDRETMKRAVNLLK